MAWPVVVARSGLKIRPILVGEATNEDLRARQPLLPGYLVTEPSVDHLAVLGDEDGHHDAPPEDVGFEKLAKLS